MVQKAKEIAHEAHKGVKRKWSDAPYIVHPERCALRAALHKLPDEVIAAMWLHDVVEDAGAELDDIEERKRIQKQWSDRIERECGPEVLGLVLELTFPVEGKEWLRRPRAEKNLIREAQMRKMSPLAMMGKMIDSIDNYGDSMNVNKGYLMKLASEGWRRLKILGHVHEGLAKELKEALEDMEDKIKSMK